MDRGSTNFDLKETSLSIAYSSKTTLYKLLLLFNRYPPQNSQDSCLNTLSNPFMSLNQSKLHTIDLEIESFPILSSGCPG